jgi:hypothetical protein
MKTYEEVVAYMYTHVLFISALVSAELHALTKIRNWKFKLLSLLDVEMPSYTMLPHP